MAVPHVLRTVLPLCTRLTLLALPRCSARSLRTPWPQLSSRHANLDVHEWHGSFQGRPAAFRMTSVIGHVLSIDFPGGCPGPGSCGQHDGHASHRQALSSMLLADGVSSRRLNCLSIMPPLRPRTAPSQLTSRAGRRLTQPPSLMHPR